MTEPLTDPVDEVAGQTRLLRAQGVTAAAGFASVRQLRRTARTAAASRPAPASEAAPSAVAARKPRLLGAPLPGITS